MTNTRKKIDGNHEWVVVANQSTMRIFTTNSDGEFVEVVALANPDAELQTSDLVSDRPGRSFDSRGEGRHAMEPGVDPKEHDAIQFAKRIADELEDARTKNEFEKLILVAGPAFLGKIRAELTKDTARMVEEEVGKNLAHYEPREVREHLREHS